MHYFLIILEHTILYATEYFLKNFLHPSLSSISLPREHSDDGYKEGRKL